RILPSTFMAIISFVSLLKKKAGEVNHPGQNSTRTHPSKWSTFGARQHPSSTRDAMQWIQAQREACWTWMQE
ncbi:MAG: hypothetical protein KJ675_17240, partial [Gammaproteobacteria bacterium]|nr:hypothetical protein [Gammaproteobacteria bacterium]